MPSFPSVASVIVALFATTLLFNALPVQATPSALVHGGFMNLKHRHSRLDAAIRDVDSQALAKRESGEFTWFRTGLGACGGHNVDSDYIVALNTPQWDGGSHCGKPVTITINGKTATATVVDRCVGCPHGNLDFSIGLFKHWESDYVRVGTLHGTWSFGGSAAESPKPSPTPKPTPTTTTTSSRTSTRISTSSSTSSTAVTTSSSTTTSESSTAATSTSASSTAEPSSTPTIPTGVLNQVNYAMLEMANIALRPSS